VVARKVETETPGFLGDNLVFSLQLALVDLWRVIRKEVEDLLQTSRMNHLVDRLPAVLYRGRECRIVDHEM
jgi:hypothetical protein